MTKKRIYDGLSEKYKVLLITFRKAKVLETKANTDNFLTDLRRFPNIDFEEIEKINQSIACTNAHIQMIIEHEYTHIGTVLCTQRISSGYFTILIPVRDENTVFPDGDCLSHKIHIFPCQRQCFSHSHSGMQKEQKGRGIVLFRICQTTYSVLRQF